MVYNVKDGKVVASNAVDAGASGHGALAGLLSEPGVSVLIGGGARQAPEEAGITLRALVWCEKATRMLRSLLERFAREGDGMLEGTGVYVCTICGYIYIGNDPPAVCPVCKVPNWKFEKIEGRAM